ncbi:MAG: dockerin type I domain-containing protein [Patescibacteria group bacterium]|nr:dockerin type I domain-containing protein [Patescibacteria group bacterium]MCL5261837.1 dockerin type I domain-containing protein [Patescibacteria group bacterium]
MASPQTITVIYGAGGGASGATATSTVGNSVFTTQSRVSDSGTLTNIASSPTVMVTDVASVFTLNSPGPITAGTRAGYTVTRKDSFGNLVTIGSTVVNLSSSSTGANKKFYDAASGGNIITSVTIPDGSSSANFWYYDELAGTWTITASQSGFTSGTDNLIVNPASASALFLNHPGTISAGTRAAYTVTRKDSFGNLVTSGTIGVSLSSNSTGNFNFYDAGSGGNIITSININNGSSSANFWYTDDKAGTWTITASSGALTPGTDLLTVIVSATKFVILDPGPGTAGVPLTITIQAQDSYGSVDTTYNQGVTLNTTGSATGGGLITITNGVGTKNITDNVAEIITLSLTDSQSTGLDVSSTRSVTFAPSSASALFLNHPGPITAGTRAGYTVTRKDSFGNLVTSGTTTVSLSSNSTGTNKAFYDAASGGNIITSINITAGNSSASFWYYDDFPETWTITASSGALTPGTDSLVVNPSSASALFLNHPGTISAGTRASYTVTRKDSFGNLVTSGTTTVSLSSNSTGNYKFYDAASGGNIITSIDITSGNSSANFWYFDDKAGTWTITVSSGVLTPGTDSLTVIVAATKFVIIQPANGTVDNPIAVTVQAQDSSGALAGTYSNSVTLVVSGSATGGGVVNIVNGEGTRNISDTVAETVNLSLTDSNSTGLDVSSTKSVIFAPGAVSAFFLNHPGSVVANSRASYTVTRKDQYGNLATSGVNTAYLYSSSSSANKKFYDAASGGNIIISINITAGNSSADFWYVDDTPGTYTITASDNVAAPDGAAGIADAADSLMVTSLPSTATKLVILPPTNNTVSSPVSVTIQAQRADNSVDTSFNNSVTIVVSGSATGGGVVTITNGTGTANITDSVAETVNLSLSDTAPTGLDVSSTQTVTFTAATVAKFALNNPGNMTAGARLGYTVSRLDSFNNTITTGVTIIYLYSTSTSSNKKFYDAATGSNVIQSIDIPNGASTANFWYYDDTAGTYVITVSDNATAPDGSAGITDASRSVVVAPLVVTATKFIMSVSPATAQTGSPISVTIKAVDNSNNLATTFNGSVTLVVSGSATGGGAVTIASGVGAASITDSVSETVNFSLSDTASTGLNVSATSLAIWSAAPPPPAAPTPVPGYFRADILFRGKAFPGAKVALVYLDNTTGVVKTLTQTTVTSSYGDFEVRFNGLTERGIYTYALSVTDRDGHSVQTRSYKLDVAGALFEENIVVSPTVSILRESVTKGDFATIQGYATPRSAISFTVDRQAFDYGTSADVAGFYKILFNTGNLNYGSHAVQTRQRLTDGRQSEFSPQVFFNVSQLFTTQTDLNGDGVVDVKDLSIFLSLWNSTDQAARKRIDFNGDGVVDVKDFSIFVRTVQG